MDLQNSKHPYLSAVVTARNDDHGGNLLGRMQIFVSALIAQAKRHNLASEPIIVEWNPPEGRPTLMEALEWPADLGACRVRLITAPPALHARYRHNEALPLFQMIAKNVGIRRARGRFLLATNAVNLDSVLCYTAHHGGLCEEILRDPCRIYHIEHAIGSGWTPEGEGKLYARLAASGIPRLDHRELMGWAAQIRRFDSTMIFNLEDGGLAREQLAETTLPSTASIAI